MLVPISGPDIHASAIFSFYPYRRRTQAVKGGCHGRIPMNSGVAPRGPGVMEIKHRRWPGGRLRILRPHRLGDGCFLAPSQAAP